MAVVIVDIENFKKEVLEAEQTVLVDFWASWCGPCKMMAPVVEQIAQEHPEIKVCKCSVEEDPTLAIQYQVSSIPAFVVFKGGEAVDRTVGAQDKSGIEAIL